ncbi:MAG: hypothetical protein ABSA65_13905 [Acidimicrobiales bacterium]|jgi:hypothetical protein
MADADTRAEGRDLPAASGNQVDKFDALSEQVMAILRAGSPHLFGPVPARELQARTTRKQKTRRRDLARIGHDLCALFPDEHQIDLIAANWGGRLAEAEIVGELEPAIATLLEREFGWLCLGDGRWRRYWLMENDGSVRFGQECSTREHQVVRLKCTRCETDRRGELGIIGRFTCDTRTRFAIWLWRDVRLGRGPLIRAQPPWPDVHLAPRCRKCGGTPKMNLRTLVAKLSEPTWRHSELLIEPGGRFVAPTNRVPRLGVRPAMSDRQVDRQAVGRP